MQNREQKEIELIQEAGKLVAKLLDFWGNRMGRWTMGRKRRPWPMSREKNDIYLNAIAQEQERIQS